MVLLWTFVTCSTGASRDLCGAFSTFLEIETPPFCQGYEGGSLVGVDDDPCRGDKVKLENAAVTNKAWPLQKAFFVDLSCPWK
jgi:hypothetical protein